MPARQADSLTPTVLDPMFMMDEITVLRLPFMMPWIWKHCLVVALRSFWPYWVHRSSTRRYSSGVTSPAGDLHHGRRG